MLTAFRWLFYLSAKLGLCSSSSTVHQSRPPVSKWLSTCQWDPPCPKLCHHSSTTQPWDKSNYLFLHLWQTLHLFPSTYPSVHTSIVLCPLVCLSFALWASLHTCTILPVQFDWVTMLSHIHAALCSRALAGRYMYDIYALFIHTSIKGSTIWQSERCDSLTNLWLFFGQNMGVSEPSKGTVL